jgi:hypothetical protein
MHHAKPADTAAKPADEAATPLALTPAPDALERFIKQIRKLSAEARPDKPTAATIEGTDTRLVAALTAATLSPSAEHLRDVASEYARIGVNDRAYEMTRAIARDKRGAAGHDAQARLWRDSGFPERGLPDAYRAVYYAPASLSRTTRWDYPSSGRRMTRHGWNSNAPCSSTRRRCMRFRTCYAWLLDGRGTEAEIACDKALQVNPASRPPATTWRSPTPWLATTARRGGRSRTAATPQAQQHGPVASRAARISGRPRIVRRVLELRPDLHRRGAAPDRAGLDVAEEEEE